MAGDRMEKDHNQTLVSRTMLTSPRAMLHAIRRFAVLLAIEASP